MLFNCSLHCGKKYNQGKFWLLKRQAYGRKSYNFVYIFSAGTIYFCRSGRGSAMLYI